MIVECCVTVLQNFAPPLFLRIFPATIVSGEDGSRSTSVPDSAGGYSSLSMSSLGQNVEYDTIQQSAPASDYVAM